VAEAVTAELEALHAGLQRRMAIASARAVLELMQDTAHVMSKVGGPSPQPSNPVPSWFLLGG
jgi:hypothetical protein